MDAVGRRRNPPPAGAPSSEAYRGVLKRFDLVRITDLHAREVPEGVLHPQKRVAELVARHAALFAGGEDFVDERRRVGRMKDDAGQHRAAVAGGDDARFEERLVFALRGEHFATDVIARQDQKRRARQNVEGGAMRAEKRHAKDRAMRAREHARESTLARVVETVGELGGESSRRQRVVPGRSLAIFRLRTSARRRRRGALEKRGAQRRCTIALPRRRRAGQKFIVNGGEGGGHAATHTVVHWSGRMGNNRVFFPQAALDQWISDGKVDLAGDELTIKPEARRYRILEAARILREVTGLQDANELVGKVKTLQYLSGLGADLLENSMVLGDNAYDVIPGFLGAPVGSFEEHRAEAKGGSHGAGAGGSAPPGNDEELLAKFLLGNL